MDLKEIEGALSFYIRPDTFPLAVRLCEDEAEAPERARGPAKDLGFQIPVCQAFGIARRYGWTLALGPEDESCPFGALALGFVRAKEGYLDGTFAQSIGLRPKEGAARAAEAMPRLPYGRYSRLVLAPLAKADFEPQLILVYGNSAQVMRLVQGRVLESGGPLAASASGGMDCADIIAQTLLTDECQWVLPCNGDRIFGLTQDHEMAFTMPMSKVETTLRGLEISHRSGAQRYPIPSYMRSEVQLPPTYYQLMGLLKEEE